MYFRNLYDPKRELFSRLFPMRNLARKLRFHGTNQEPDGYLRPSFEAAPVPGPIGNPIYEEQQFPSMGYDGLTDSHLLEDPLGDAWRLEQIVSGNVRGFGQTAINFHDNWDHPVPNFDLLEIDSAVREAAGLSTPDFSGQGNEALEQRLDDPLGHSPLEPEPPEPGI